MSLKKLINSPEDCVDQCIYGLQQSYPGLIVHTEHRTIFSKIFGKNQKVAVVSGGGSGHEPFPAGYVGEGMLSACVSGSIFTSPPKNNILHAIRTLSANGKDIFLIIPNYTGDRLNFGLAIETAREEGINVESITVGDDISLESDPDSIIEFPISRRGTCGLIVAMKIAGFLAKEGKTLEEIKSTMEMMKDYLATVGLCVEPCSIPGSGWTFTLGEDEVEFGVGIHGEAGVKKMKLKSANETVTILLKYLVDYLGIRENDEAVCLVNNLGSLSQLEQWIVAGEVEKQMTEKRIKLLRLYCGPMLTSLNMIGIQITLLKLISSTKYLILESLDEPTTAAAWPGSFLSANNISTNFISTTNLIPPKDVFGGSLTQDEAKMFEKCLKEGSTSVVGNIENLNHLDRICGDGDCGDTIGRFAKAILKGIQEERFTFYHPAMTLKQLSDVAETIMGGTSGALYALFLTGASGELSNHMAVNNPKAWAKAWAAGVRTIKKYSTAKSGDRTLLDALEPGCESFQKYLEEDSMIKALSVAMNSACEGCSQTKFMKPKVGRASYVRTSKLQEIDAGAFGVIIWLKAFCHVLTGSQPQDISFDCDKPNP